MKLIIKSLLCILAVALINRCEKGEQKKSSNLQIGWLNCYGGSNDDQVSSIIHTSDGGYLVNGTTESKLEM